MPKATSSADAPSSSSSSSSTSSSSSSSPPAAVVARSPTTPSSHNAAEAASANVDNDADCRDCLSYLTRALDANGSSRTMSLLRALGAMSHRRGGVAGGGGGDDDDDDARAGSMRGGGMCDDDGGGVDDDGGRRVYEPLAGGRGVLISLSNSDASREALRLRRRMRNAATATTTPISHAAESSVGVLTTSPSSSSSRRASSRDDDDVDFDVDAITTIAIECATCGSDTRAEAGARAFVSGPDNLGIVLCSNRLSSQSEIDEVLVHELVHIYDAHSRQMDLRDCRQLAYSEVRAAREAECSNRLTSFTTNVCAKDTATRATRNMFPESGRQCVCDVFDVAVRDRAPFMEEDARGAAFRTSGCGGKVVSHPPTPARRPSAVSKQQQQQQQKSNTPFAPPRWSDR